MKDSTQPLPEHNSSTASPSPSPWLCVVNPGAPSLQNNTADAERLISALKPRTKSDRIFIDYELLQQLPEQLRRCSADIRCVLFRDQGRWQLISVGPAADPSTVAALAVDLGTSRVVLRLLDLATSQILAESSFDNPQSAVGPDILSRIHHADTFGGLKHQQDLIIGSLNREIKCLCQTCGLERQHIHLMSLAGNTAMTHLFLALTPRWLIREPYIPAVNQPGLIPARALGLKLHSSAAVFVFPNIGSYFGGDLIAGILSAGLNRSDQTAILVDVGTNAEVVLGNRSWLVACAGAAGPALEGGVTRMGMMAGPGVIDRIAIDPRSLEFTLHTIDELPPRGICGSGLIDLAAQLFKAGMVDIRGKLVPARCGRRLEIVDELAYLEVVPAEQAAGGKALTISQADLDSLIRSKAAMYSILETICGTVGVTLDQVAAFFVAGTFGSFIDPLSAITIGMLPDLPLPRYRPLGNSSLEGATLALTVEDSLAEIERIRDSITYLELNVNQDFMNRFSAAKFLPHTNTALFPSVSRPQS